ncbi:MAG: low molecular weight protein-tyrosine-phosphatase [Pseudomonadota bacterium]
MRVLCVCLGNICRSPTAEAVLRQVANGHLDVDSAGTAGWHIGKPPYGPAVAAAAARGYDLSDLRARQFVPEDFAAFDLILTMDDQNLEDIVALRPPGNVTPVKLFMDYAPDAGRPDIPDPYYTRDFDEALDLIEAAAAGLVGSLV